MHREHSTVIAAPLSLLWRLTTDVTAWPSFMPTVQRVERLDAGPLRVGSSARVKQPAQTAAVWTVTRLEPSREFTWETRRLGLLMTGRHLLEPAGEGTRNTLVIDVTGRGSRVFAALFGAMITRVLREEAAAFERAARDSTAARP
jgi:ribosome-associated toxin RatA of RatAB toxin-antitoxin module